MLRKNNRDDKLIPGASQVAGLRGCGNVGAGQPPRRLSHC